MNDEQPSRVHGKLFGSPIECTVRIESRIEEILADKDHYTFLYFYIYCGNDEPYLASSGYIHEGSQEGETWEQARQVWELERRYIADHIGQAMMYLGSQVCDEAKYALTLKVDLDKFFASSLDLEYYLKRDSIFGSSRQPGEPIFTTEFQAWTAEHALHSKNRIIGYATSKIGSEKSLRYIRRELEKFLSLYQELLPVWQKARSIHDEWHKNNNWRDLIKDKCGNLDDDLVNCLDDWHEKRNEWRWKPSQIAIVNAARDAGVSKKGKWFSHPDINEWQKIRRELKEDLELFSIAQKLGLKW
jgi:hypothetical protein